MAYDEAFAGAARLWAEAMADRPQARRGHESPAPLQRRLRRGAGGCGQGKDEPPLDEAAKAAGAKQAIDWLKADLAFWTKQSRRGPPRPGVRRSDPPALEGRPGPGGYPRSGRAGQAPRRRAESVSGPGAR